MTAIRIFYILHIEDNPDDAEIIGRFFAKSEEKFKITSARTGLEALEKMTKQYYDAILLDYKLPRMDGLEVLEDMRKRNIYTPVIMLTGAEDVRVAVDAMRLGASDYIVKSLEDYEKLPAKTMQAIHDYGLQNMFEEEVKNRRIKMYENKFATSLLMNMIDKEVDLNPVSSLEYSYEPDLLNILDIAQLEFEELLELLSSVKILIRKNEGVMMCCSNCGSANIKNIYHCPHCKSSSFTKKIFFEHTKCGYVDVEKAFQKGNKLVCPNCNKELLNGEVDFKKIGVMFKCQDDCEEFFTELDIDFSCNNCGTKFDLKDAVFKDQYAYAINQDLIDEIKNNLKT